MHSFLLDVTVLGDTRCDLMGVAFDLALALALALDLCARARYRVRAGGLGRCLGRGLGL